MIDTNSRQHSVSALDGVRWRHRQRPLQQSVQCADRMMLPVTVTPNLSHTALTVSPIDSEINCAYDHFNQHFVNRSLRTFDPRHQQLFLLSSP